MVIKNVSELEFVIGNRYKKVPVANAKVDSTGKKKLTNSWTAFVEFKKSDEEDLKHLTFSDLVSHVTFELHETYKDADKVKRVNV